MELAYHSNLYNYYRAKYRIHLTFKFNGNKIFMYGEGIIEIGENSYIGRFSNLQVSFGNRIKIGKNCRVGPFFSIWTESADVDSDFINFCYT